MKLLPRTLLLSLIGAAIVSGTSVEVSALKSSRAPKEPPSTVLTVHSELPLLEQPPQVVALAIQPIDLMPEVFTTKYIFWERSKRVRLLQKKLGTVGVDGLYGPQTRAAHIKKIKELGGTPSAIVPEVAPRYNISYSPSERCPQFEDEFRKHGLEPVDVFSYIAYRESRCNPGAVNAKWKDGKIIWTLNKNGTYDSGLLQINSSWSSVVANTCQAERGDLKVLFNVNCNLKVAKFIMDESTGKLANWSVRKIG
jgi:hypothetical protein